MTLSPEPRQAWPPLLDLPSADRRTYLAIQGAVFLQDLAVEAEEIEKRKALGVPESKRVRYLRPEADLDAEIEADISEEQKGATK